MFKKAVRNQVKLKMALTGVSGSGKTYSALLFARGLVGNSGKIAVIDTENGSASLYAGLTDFDVCTLEAPFTVEKYTKAINAAVEAGYNALVIDSITHAWKEILSMKEKLDMMQGSNSYTNWAKMTPKHEAFLNALLQSNIHVITTMRSKQDYVLVENEKGKMAPKKVGMAPVQREGMEYEFTVVFDIDNNHNATASKDRTGLFDGQVFPITQDTGDTVAKWLDSGEMIKLPKGNFENLKKAIEGADDETMQKLMLEIPKREWTKEEQQAIKKLIGAR